MRIKSVEITNFRCLKHVDIAFDDITTFIGPNGAGKSTVLRALDWFFNGDKKSSLTDEDVHFAADEKKMIVRVDFTDISAQDREALGDKYAPEGVDELSVQKTWDQGSEKITGKALAFAPFELVRSGANASERGDIYKRYRAEHPELDLPNWSSDAAMKGVMDEWERGHRDLLTEAQISDTNFFGFAGQGKLSGLFDYVFVGADLRASEESMDTRSSIVGRILEKAIDRTAANEALATLSQELAARHAAINQEHIDTQVTELSQALTDEVQSFTSGRHVQIMPAILDYTPQTTRFKVRIGDGGYDTDVEKQGHGFQRALLISALKLLAQHGAGEGNESVLCLAVEEPELFQHPTQAKAFASTLRTLAETAEAGIQIVYATHSPYFIEPRYFDQIRRVHREQVAGEGGHVTVSVTHATVDAVCRILDGYMDSDAVRRRLDNACLNELREALFAEAVALVEGTDDKGILEGAASNQGSILSLSGIEIALASKVNMYLPAAILRELKIPCYILFDGDNGKEQRMIDSGHNATTIAAEKTATITQNRKLLAFIGATEEDWPESYGSELFSAFPDTLETFISEQWPELETKKAEIITAGLGYPGKDSYTYFLAAKGADGDVPEPLAQIIDKLRSLV